MQFGSYAVKAQVHHALDGSDSAADTEATRGLQATENSAVSCQHGASCNAGVQHCVSLKTTISERYTEWQNQRMNYTIIG